MPNKEEIANALYKEGFELYHNGKIEEAAIAFQKATNLFEECGDYRMYARTINALGITYASVGNEFTAVDCYLRGLQIVKQFKIMGLANVFLNNIGTRYQDLGDDESALYYFAMAEEEMLAMGPCTKNTSAWFIVSYLNMGMSYLSTEDYFNAEFCLKKARNYALEYDNLLYMFSIDVIFAKLREAMGDRDFVGNHVDELVGYSTVMSDNITDYIQDCGELVALFLKTGHTNEMNEVIKNFEGYAENGDNVNMRLKLSEFYMSYYKAIQDVDRYQQACVDHAKWYAAVQAMDNQEHVIALNVKIALQKVEDDMEKVLRYSKEDQLTGLQNRAALDDDGKMLTLNSMQRGQTMAVGIMDIDCFKQYNDHYGHLQGDEVLRNVAQILMNAIGEGGNVYRYGGDEFVLLFQDTTMEQVEKVAQGIEEGLKKANIAHADSYVSDEVTISQGYIVLEPTEGCSFAEVLDHADTVLYDVKDSGKKNYKVLRCDGTK